MNRLLSARALLLSCILGSCLHSVTALAEAPTGTPASPPPSVPRDGQHDFDFNIGTWKTHIRRWRKELGNELDNDVYSISKLAAERETIRLSLVESGTS